MVAIADSGSTKADWAFIEAGRSPIQLQTRGFNPVFHDEKFILSELQGRIGTTIDRTAVSKVYYYGSGCWDDKRKSVVRRALQSFFPNAAFLDVQHDLIGAARATCGADPGIACILGTGSNSCKYDGKDVVDNVTNLGYLLGDEGSGTHLGKMLIRAYFYREFPRDLLDEFRALCPGGKREILDQIYEGEAPNLYLASFARFCSKHREHPFVQSIVGKAFGVFLDRHVLKYPGHRSLPIHFIGSIAFHFRQLLDACCRSRGLQLGKVVKKPIDHLIQFHREQEKLERAS